ncbi:hypothetical protein F2Q68_00003174 [Brassica cretica]|uniref:Uncharacterized protein n=1 Tax=Brassica cretica TaxID=69181 RepID=A0A8S9JEU2_BRACR|nr:hypothetical protein F2Q68_00003174 [Brassica cretica]
MSGLVATDADDLGALLELPLYHRRRHFLRSDINQYSDEVTGAEIMRIGKIFAYTKQECQGRELTWKHASELVDNNFEFRVKMSDYNSTDKTQAITVTKIVSPGVLPPVTTQLKSLLMQTMKLMCSLKVSLQALDSILISEMKVSVTGMNHRRLSVRNVENKDRPCSFRKLDENSRRGICVQ